MSGNPPPASALEADDKKKDLANNILELIGITENRYYMASVRDKLFKDLQRLPWNSLDWIHFGLICSTRPVKPKTKRKNLRKIGIGILNRQETFDMATIRPLNDRVIIKRVDKVEGVSAGGIIIPENARERPQEGVVIAVGPGRRLDAEVEDRQALDLKVNDRVLFGKFAGTEITLDNEEYLIMREDDILGVIEA